MGRLFTAEESRGGPYPVALLANAYWRQQFNADPAIVGKAVQLNGTAVTIRASRCEDKVGLVDHTATLLFRRSLAFKGHCFEM
jgi:hypothetical protein